MLEHCHAGTLSCWDTVVLGHCRAGTLSCWDTVMLGHRHVGTLSCWDTVVLGHCHAGTLSCKINQLPFLKNFAASLSKSAPITFDAHIHRIHNSLLSPPPPLCTNSLWITPCLSQKCINIILILDCWKRKNLGFGDNVALISTF